jgi:hypothetical protein
MCKDTTMTTKKKAVRGIAVLVALLGNAVFAQGQKTAMPFQAGVKLLIEEMESGLGGYLRAEIMKKKVPVTLVASAEAADFIMTGESQDRKSGWSEGWLTTKKDNSTGSVTVLSAATQDIVWPEETHIEKGPRSRGCLWCGR